MSLNFLQVEPEVAIKIISDMIIEGYELKDKFTKIFFQHGAEKFQSELQASRNSCNDWIGRSCEQLEKVFTSPVEALNLRDSAPPPTAISFTDGTNDLRHLKSEISYRITTLSKYRQFIFTYYKEDIKFVFAAGRDLLVQEGNGKISVKN